MDIRGPSKGPSIHRSSSGKIRLHFFSILVVLYLLNVWYSCAWEKSPVASDLLSEPFCQPSKRSREKAICLSVWCPKNPKNFMMWKKETLMDIIFHSASITFRRYNLDLDSDKSPVDCPSEGREEKRGSPIVSFQNHKHFPFFCLHPFGCFFVRN